MGTMFLAHGALLKLATFGLAGTMGYFGSIGYPPAIGVVVIAAEIAGRPGADPRHRRARVSLALIPLMLGALLQHTGNGWMFSGKGGGWEFPAFWTLALLVQAGLGAGALALRPGRPVSAGKGRSARRRWRPDPAGQDRVQKSNYL